MEINMWIFISVIIILLLIAVGLALKGILDGAIWLLVIDILLLVVGLVISKDIKKPTIKYLEYPASSYTLEYKVTEFQEKVDTIYVLIPKEYNKYKNGN